MKINFIDKAKLEKIVKNTIELKREQLNQLVIECQNCLKSGDLKKAKELLDKAVIMREEIMVFPFSLTKKLTPEADDEYMGEFKPSHDTSAKVDDLPVNDASESLDATSEKNNSAISNATQNLDTHIQNFDGTLEDKGHTR